MDLTNAERASKGYVHSSYMDLEKLVALLKGMQLVEFKLTKADEGWRVLLKASRGHERQLAIFYVHRFEDGLELAVELLEASQLSWFRDKYPFKLAKVPREKSPS